MTVTELSRPVPRRAVRGRGPATAVLCIVCLVSAMTASLAGAGHAPADAWMVLVLGLSVAGRVALVGLVGCLVLALLVCHEGSDGPTGSLLESASRWAAAWSATLLLLLGLEIWSPAAVSRGAAGPDAGDLAARLRWLVVSAGLALLVHVLARACRTRRDVAVVLGVVVPAVWVGVGLGHGGPVLSPTALGIATTVHVLAACAWTGGLLALATHRSAWAGPRARLLHAYSNVALAAFVALAASGVLGLALRTSWDQLQGGGHYVALVGTKAALLVLLGACGACQRRVLLRRVDRGEPGAFLTMAAGELVLLGMATGLAVALAHSAG